MSKYDLTCNYCNHKWMMESSEFEIEVFCALCGDTDIKIKKHSSATSDIFGYNNVIKPDAYVKKGK